MENIYINHFAVLSCAIFNMLLGAAWYSPALFYEAWKKENKLTDEIIGKANPVKIYALSFLSAYIMSYNLAFFLGDANTDALWGTSAGFLAGFGCNRITAWK